MPAELYPSLAFDSLFESKGSRTQLSVLDHVLEQLNDVSRKVSHSDRAKIDEYATSVREVEQRLARLQRKPAGRRPAVQQSDQRAAARRRPADASSTHTRG